MSFAPSNKRRVPTPEVRFIRLGQHRQRLFGWGLLSASAFLFIACVSYLSTGVDDQSIVDNLWLRGWGPSSLEAENWLGLTGALAAHYLILESFGIAGCLIPILTFLFSIQLLVKKIQFPFKKWLRMSSFILIWVGIVLGYLTQYAKATSALHWLSGKLGYTIAFYADRLIGWGLWVLLALGLVAFTSYHFGIRWSHIIGFLETLRPSSPSTPKTITAQARALPIAKTKAPKPTSLPAPATAIPLVLESVAETAPEINSDPARGNPIEFVIETPLEPATQKTKPSPPSASSFASPYDPTAELRQYKKPSIQLLQSSKKEEAQVSQEELEQNKNKIISTLSNFKIGIERIHATIGPTVTLYEIVPQAGIRVAKIKGFEMDLALSLSALGIRIIAPIPGKGTIGIEVPNKTRAIISLKNSLVSDAFSAHKGALPIILGKSIDNQFYVEDLAHMPHLLIAGATGQGKSVGLNVMLLSLLYKKHPAELKFILVDPKKVELSLFSIIEKHFLAQLPNSEESIITDTKKVIHTLNALCAEMDLRYNLLKAAGCRAIAEYNNKFKAHKLLASEGHRFLPYIVLVIDELADLMMTAGKEIETPIARLAQLARAIGIHLVVATQRPSVNVITGVIKANFPARISFRVSSQIDSRTILDTGGADQLVGQGDMLYSSGSALVRLQGPYASTQEVEDVCTFISRQAGYETPYLLPEVEMADDLDTKTQVDSERDQLFAEAARLIVQHQQGSTSLIQRRMAIGYARAGRLMDQLESHGIVGGAQGSKPREVLIKDEMSLEKMLSQLS